MRSNFLRHLYPGPDQILGGRYQIVQQLGSGGFGQTFMAQDLHLPGHPFCALKQLKPQVKGPQDLQAAERLFEKEAQALYQLGNHPQIPRLLAHFEENKKFYLVQELIEGQSLEVELKQKCLWSDAQVTAFLNDLLGTLAFIHEHRVIHRDLKPSNLIRRQSDGRIVVIDFGAVKQVGTQLSAFPSTMSHTITVGTHGYMPNEQLAGRPQFSSDVYAVGMIAVQALTGQHPTAIYPHDQTGELDWHGLAPFSNPDLVAFLDYLLRYDFRSRYVNAGEALLALQSLSTGHPTPPSARVRADFISADSSRSEPNLPEVLVYPDQTHDVFHQYSPSFFEARTLPFDIDSAVVQAEDSSKLSFKSSSKSNLQSKRSRQIALPIVGLLLGFGLLAWRTYTPSPRVGTSTTSRNRLPSKSAASTQTEAPNQGKVKPAAPRRQEILRPSPAVSIDSSSSKTQSLKSQATKKIRAYWGAKKPEPAMILSPKVAQDTVETLYQQIFSKDWNTARSLLSSKLAQQFEPDFYGQFLQVTVDRFRVIHQSAQNVRLAVENTYVYLDQSTQQEERTYTVQMINGHPYITDSAFTRIIKARSR
jgi:eukaryotic-like serine/threonine-protein kinase